PHPAAAAFDRAVRAIAFAPATAEARSCRGRNRNFAYHDYDLDFSITWRSDRIIAVAFHQYLDTGNGHPGLTVRSFVLDLEHARALALADLFDAPALAQLERICQEQIEVDHGAGAVDAALLGTMLRSFESWTISPAEVTITFPRDTILGGAAPGG